MDRASSEEKGVYVISVAAELAGVHPQTLRMYERKGLISPKRTSGNSRRYSARDVEWVRRIQVMTQDQGINLAGVRMIIQMQEELDKMQSQLERARRRPADGHSFRESGRRLGALVRLRDVQDIFQPPAGSKKGPR